MTESQSATFRLILDVNWDMNRAVENNDFVKAMELHTTLNELKKELRDDMGHEAYETFMSNGRKMFAPKTNA